MTLHSNSLRRDDTRAQCPQDSRSFGGEIFVREKPGLGAPSQIVENLLRLPWAWRIGCHKIFDVNPSHGSS
jgi:hypothetical protein